MHLKFLLFLLLLVTVTVDMQPDVPVRKCVKLFTQGLSIVPLGGMPVRKDINRHRISDLIVKKTNVFLSVR